MKTCERCRRSWRPKRPTQRFCYGCAKALIQELEGKGAFAPDHDPRHPTEERGRSFRHLTTLGGSVEMETTDERE